VVGPVLSAADAELEHEVDVMSAKVLRPLPSSQVDNRPEAFAQREPAYVINDSKKLSPPR
jgi:hypothetical protein